jgi:hypothetical protein
LVFKIFKLPAGKEYFLKVAVFYIGH